MVRSVVCHVGDDTTTDHCCVLTRDLLDVDNDWWRYDYDRRVEVVDPAETITADAYLSFLERGSVAAHEDDKMLVTSSADEELGDDAESADKEADNATGSATAFCGNSAHGGLNGRGNLSGRGAHQESVS